jgi:serine/threonine protein kinase
LVQLQSREAVASKFPSVHGSLQVLLAEKVKALVDKWDQTSQQTTPLQRPVGVKAGDKVDLAYFPQELRKEYAPEEVLGVGSYGVVVMAYRVQGGHRKFKVDIKLVFAGGPHGFTETALRSLNKEAAILGKIKSPHVVTHGTMLNPAGTHGFMSPEAYRDRKNVGPCSDVYALSATLYLLISRQMPFQAHHEFEWPFAVAGNMEEQAPRLKTVCTEHGLPGVSSGLEDILAKGLHKKIPDRYKDATEMKAAIEELEKKKREASTRPEHWAPSADPANAGGGVRLVPLQDDSILSCLQEHLCGNGIGHGGNDQQVPGDYSQLKLARAWRVENDDLYGKYKVAQRSVLSFVDRVPFSGDSKTGSKARIRSELYSSSTRLAWSMEEGCNEVRLLHGTKPDLVMSILQNGMNERFAGASAGTRFGDGSYFADDAGKIDQYVGEDQQYDGTSLLHQGLYSNSDSHPGHVFYALVFRVTLGHSVHYADKKEECFNQIGENTNRRELCNIPNTDPPTPYHSLFAEGTRVKYRFNEYVVFHSDLTYPEYLLAYQRV